MHADPTHPNRFEPPDAERVARHLAEHPAKPGMPWRRWVPAVMIGALALSLLYVVHPLLAVLPWLGLMGFMAWAAGKVQQARALQQRVVRAWELAMLRHHREALRRAWTLLPLCQTTPQLWLRCVAVMAHVLDELACYDAAIAAMDPLLLGLPKDHPMALQVRVQRANAALCTDRLADADDALRKLRGTADTLPPGPIAAGYHLARLVQDVRTGHFTEAAEQAGHTAAQLRPLGVHAGYGYGLLAYCQHQAAARCDDEQTAHTARRAAAKLWHQATLLVPPAALAFRYRELRAMLDTPAAAPTEDR